MDQEVITREEAELESEWYAQLLEQEQVILEAQEDKVNARVRQIRATWNVVTKGLYKPFKNRHDQPDMDHDQPLMDWLGTMKSGGVQIMAYSSWRKIYTTIAAALAEGLTEDRAFMLASVAPDSVSKLKDAGVIDVHAEDGSQFIGTGKDVNVVEGKNFGLLGVEKTGDYLNMLADMPSSRDASDTIRGDLKVKNLKVNALWEAPIPVGVEFRTFNVEVGAEDSEGETPYSSVVLLEKAMPKDVQRLYLRKLSQKFAHLADGKS